MIPPTSLRSPQVRPIFLIGPEKSWFTKQQPVRISDRRLKVSFHPRLREVPLKSKEPMGEESGLFVGRNPIRVHKLSKDFLSSITNTSHNKHTKQTNKKTWRFPLQTSHISIYVYIYIYLFKSSSDPLSMQTLPGTAAAVFTSQRSLYVSHWQTIKC